MTGWKKSAAGCGCVSVLAVIMVVSLVAWGFSYIGHPISTKPSDPVPFSVPPAQAVAVEAVDINAPGRTADSLADWARPLAQETGVPEPALRAYGNAELIARESWPECGLRWNTLAGLGYVETRHGTYNGNWFNPSKLSADGHPEPPITGIALDGNNGTAVIADTDGGVIDGDPVHDRAVGPMQFIPSSWAIFGSDANGDGVADPRQIDDAAVGAAALLCSGGRNLDDAEQWTAAIMSYNSSEEYVRKVAIAANSYALNRPARV